MKVGDYVRTKDGRIGKIRDIVNENDINYIFTDLELGSLFDEDILKSSPNIIDLIEVRDYVNGYEVTSKDQFLGFGNHDWYMSNDEIKSIVTKEQFKGCEYKL